MHERCGTNPWRSTRGRCFPHVPACLDCFAGPERSERKGLGHLCWRQRFPGQPSFPATCPGQRPEERALQSLGWSGLLQACLCHTGRFSGKKQELRVSLVCYLPQQPVGTSSWLPQRFGFECELAGFYTCKSPVFYPQRDFASQGRGKETPTPLCWGCQHPGHPPAGWQPSHPLPWRVVRWKEFTSSQAFQWV